MSKVIEKLQECFKRETGYECEGVSSCLRVKNQLVCALGNSAIDIAEWEGNDKEVRIKTNGKQIVYSANPETNKCLMELFNTTSQKST